MQGLSTRPLPVWVQKRRRKRGEYPQTKLPGSVSSGITFVEAQIEKPSEPALQGALEVQTTEGVRLMIRSQREVDLAAHN